MKAFTGDMKEIYTAVNRDQAASALAHFEQPTNEAGAESSLLELCHARLEKLKNSHVSKLMR